MDDQTSPGTALFVTGSSRSGTELMRTLLNMHPEVHIAAETHYFEDLRPRLTELEPARARTMTLDYFAQLRGSAYGLGGAETSVPSDRAVAELLATTGPEPEPDAIFRAHCRIAAREAGCGAAPLWGEKTPRHVFRGDEILSRIPGARIIHMLRDPRAVAASYHDWENHWHDGQVVPEALRAALDRERRRVRATRSITVQALAWRAATATAMALRERYGPGRVRIQSFEALLRRPEAEIADICAFTGLRPVPGMGRVGLVNSSYAAEGEKTGMEAGVADRWRERLSEAEIWWIDWLTRTLAAPAGYRPAGGDAYPGFALWELFRTASRLPAMVAANRARSAHHARMLMTRVRAALGNSKL